MIPPPQFRNGFALLCSALLCFALLCFALRYRRRRLIMPTLTLPRLLFLSFLLRLILFLHGLYQDAHSTFKYTDIDYYVFTDAARALSHGQSPYTRETYRYTPLLAWLLLPTTWAFSSGKLLFALSDMVAGWGIYRILLRSRGMTEQQALGYSASCWLLNPMVATISTRGSSEGLLGVMAIGLLWAAVSRRTVLAGVILGFATHFKIYPVIYAPAILLWTDSDTAPLTLSSLSTLRFATRKRVLFSVAALATFVGLNLKMHAVYGQEFLYHTYLHHFVRLDHRHNFSPYNILLYLVSSPAGRSEMPFAKWAFLPQMLLSAVLVPLAGAHRDLPGTMFVQTFAFVAFNKVCTSQVCFPPPFSCGLLQQRTDRKPPVLHVVHRPPAIHPPLQLLPPELEGKRDCSAGAVGPGPGRLVEARLPAGVFGREHFLSRTLGFDLGVLCRQLLDVGRFH